MFSLCCDIILYLKILLPSMMFQNEHPVCKERGNDTPLDLVQYGKKGDLLFTPLVGLA